MLSMGALRIRSEPSLLRTILSFLITGHTLWKAASDLWYSSLAHSAFSSRLMLSSFSIVSTVEFLSMARAISCSTFSLGTSAMSLAAVRLTAFGFVICFVSVVCYVACYEAHRVILCAFFLFIGERQLT